jgi:hypothetical protein
MTVPKAACQIVTAAAIAIALVAFVPNASASVIGQLDITNCAGGGSTVTLTTITFTPPSGAGGGCTDTGTPTSVSFSGGTLGSGVQGTILNLSASTIFPVIDFMTFSSVPALHFDLSQIGPGPTSTACSTVLDPNGAACSVFAGSPFILAPTATGTSITLSARGIARDGTVPTSVWQGAFTTQLSGMTPAQLQAALLSGASESNTYSGDFRISAVPEPATVSSMLLGGLLIAAGYRRRTRS